MGYGQWLHGEAVGAGMAMAAEMSLRLGWLSEQDRRRVDDLLEKAGLPCRPPGNLGVQQFLDLMAVDKKVLAGRLRLVLLQGIGGALIAQDFPPDVLEATLGAFQA